MQGYEVLVCLVLLGGIACGGKVEREGPGGALVDGGGGLPPTSNPDSGAAGGGSGWDASSCTEVGRSCSNRFECCTRLCDFNTGNPDGPGRCRNCWLKGEPCNPAVGNACCSGSCAPDGTCTCTYNFTPCRVDSDCCSAFCYQERSECLPTKCDPRVNPEADDVERCWRGY